MNDYEYDVHGAPVVYTNRAPEPFNPLNRPKINFIKPVITIIAFIFFNVVMCVLRSKYMSAVTEHFPNSEMVGILLIIAVNLLFLCIVAKRTVIWFIHLYQRYAPDEVRLKCVFEPSCSEYMIMAIKKYGLLRGLVKGIGRLLRCFPPNGGRDEP